MTTALIVAGVCLVLEALFSGSEVAVVAADRLRIRQGAEAGRRADQLLLRLLATPHRLLATTLVGTQVAVVTSTITVTLALVDRYGAVRGDLYTLLALTPILVVFGEIVPKSVAQQHADFLSRRVVWILYAAEHAFAPLVWAMGRFTGWAGHLLRLETRHKLVTREDLELIARARPSPGGDEITEGERHLISRIFDFGDRTAYDAMVPLSSVVALDEASPLVEAVRAVREKEYTRYPVYQERVDRIVGTVHAFDVLKAGRSPLNVGAIMQPPIFVPEKETLVDVLVELQRSRRGLAVVVDEYGGAVGLLTIEDILEEIVGEIEDEHDTASPAIRREADGVWRVRAQTPIAQVNRELEIELPEGADYETVAGLVLDLLRHIPSVGESTRIGSVLLKVTQASERAVEEVQVRVARR